MSTVNVNLRSCDCSHLCAANGGEHVNICAARPVHIPCPIPRSVTFTVRLGCTCPDGWGTPPEGHWRNCPTMNPKPIRVACSIGGETWEESEAKDPEGTNQDGRLVGFAFASPVHVACRARWGIVKALVMGKNTNSVPVNFSNCDWIGPLFARRDAVFGALADMARAEEQHTAARQRCVDALGDGILTRALPSVADALGQYVEHLIEQVGAL